MFFASALSECLDTEVAVEECLTALAESMYDGAPTREPHLIWVFLSGHHRSRVAYLAERIVEVHPDSVLVGCSASGLVADTVEVEGAPALVLCGAYLPGVVVRAFHFEPGDEPGDAMAWRRSLGLDSDAVLEGAAPDAVCLFADPFTVNAGAIVASLEQAFPGVPLFGAMSSGAILPGQTRLVCGGRRLDRGMVGVTFTGNIAVDTVVSQGARPIGPPMFVTRGRQPSPDGVGLIHELDGRPAMESVQAMFAQLDAADQARFKEGLLLGVVMEAGKLAYEAGDFLVRDVVGYDPEEQSALAVGAMVSTGDVIQFHVRDPGAAAEDLRQRLAQCRRRRQSAPAGALVFNGVSRGQVMFGRTGHDSAVFAATFNETPLAGFFSNGEVAPVEGQAYVHEVTACFVMFSPRSRLT